MANGLPSVITTTNYFYSDPSRAIAISLNNLAEPTITIVSTKPKIY